MTSRVAQTHVQNLAKQFDADLATRLSDGTVSDLDVAVAQHILDQANTERARGGTLGQVMDARELFDAVNDRFQKQTPEQTRAESRKDRAANVRSTRSDTDGPVTGGWGTGTVAMPDITPSQRRASQQAGRAAEELARAMGGTTQQREAAAAIGQALGLLLGGTR